MPSSPAPAAASAPPPRGWRPSAAYTEIHASGGEPERVERVKQFVPMQRGGQPEEIAQAVLWLLSEQAS